MVKALAGSTVVMASYDAFSAEASKRGVFGIPTWLELDEMGGLTGRSLTSDVWGADIPTWPPPLDAFFHGSVTQPAK